MEKSLALPLEFYLTLTLTSDFGPKRSWYNVRYVSSPLHSVKSVIMYSGIHVPEHLCMVIHCERVILYKT